jgi:transposase
MRTIGLDLAIQAEHKAIVADEQGQFITPVLKLHTRASELDTLLARARAGSTSADVQVVMEPTGMAWFPVAVYLTRQAVPLYLVNSQQVADLRRYYQRHAKSDRIDARVLAKLPLVNPEKLHRLSLRSAQALACQRGCKELERLSAQMIAIKNRVLAVDRFAWPGLHELVFGDPFGEAARWFRQHWYDPLSVSQQGVAPLRRHWLETGLNPDESAPWVEELVQLAEQVLTLYGSHGHYLDFALLQAEVCRAQEQLCTLEETHHTLRLKTVRPLYRQIHPSRNLESIRGVGQDGAAVYASFIADPQRFDSTRLFRGWTGMVPDSKQSAQSEAKGLHISQAGPGLIKKFAYIDAESARQWDPQIAALYYSQMVQYGKHHAQALCACATHVLDRVLAVLRDDRPYELRDVDGQPISPAQARQIVLERYTVPDAVRRHNNKRTRRVRRDQGAEKKRLRASRSS